MELHPSTSRTARYDITRAKRIFDMYGCVVVRGLNRQYVEEIRAHADATFEQARELMEAGELSEVVNGDQDDSEDEDKDDDHGTGRVDDDDDDEDDTIYNSVFSLSTTVVPQSIQSRD